MSYLTKGLYALPPAPMDRRTPEQRAAQAAEVASIVAGVLARFDRGQRYQVARKQTPAQRSRKQSVDWVRILRRAVIAADEAARYVDVLRLLDAGPFDLDPAQRRLEQLQANVDAQTAKVVAKAAKGCEVCKAYLST